MTNLKLIKDIEKRGEKISVLGEATTYMYKKQLYTIAFNKVVSITSFQAIHSLIKYKYSYKHWKDWKEFYKEIGNDKEYNNMTQFIKFNINDTKSLDNWDYVHHYLKSQGLWKGSC